MTENGSTLTPQDLVTTDLVNEAVKFDFGQEAEVISFEVNDFTNKGDNYSSVVKSITVKYQDNGKLLEKSYVAKINPLRTASSFTDMLEIMYKRETMVLREILGGMNSQLEKLNQPPIKAPKLYARSLEKGKEVFVTENLRTLGFKMYDRTKGMDIEHALLVVEELGRFHASSLLFEETIYPKSIPEAFDHFEEPWNDITHPSFQLFNAMLVAQSKGACEFLKTAPEYEKCTKWINSKLENIGKLFIDGFSASKPMELLNHGDCWTNNILFKYNEEGSPIDIRFVDLQCSRKSSPACDINYFYYTSLNGDVRKMHMKTMEKTYFNSFQKILKLAGKELPYTFSDFETEMIKRKQFGLVAGLLVLPIILAEGDEIMNMDNVRDDNIDQFMESRSSKFAKTAERKEGPFTERFLTMFDEMLEYKVFDE